jgi:hypothetical protein
MSCWDRPFCSAACFTVSIGVSLNVRREALCCREQGECSDGTLVLIGMSSGLEPRADLRIDRDFTY